MVNSCCGLYSLRTGCWIIALILLVTGALEMIPEDNLRFVGIIEIVCSGLLMIGIRLYEQKRFVPCMVMRSLYVGGGILGPFFTPPEKFDNGLPFGVNMFLSFLIAAINLYALVILYSYYNAMDQSAISEYSPINSEDRVSNSEQTTPPNFTDCQFTSNTQQNNFYIKDLHIHDT